MKIYKLACIRKEANGDERLGRISEVSKNSYKIIFCGKEFPAKLKGYFLEEQI